MSDHSSSTENVAGKEGKETDPLLPRTTDYTDSLASNDESTDVTDSVALNGERAEKVNYFHFKHFGLFLQYFFVGICYSFSLNINYEFFTSYLNVEGNFFNVLKAAIPLPWTFKILYGALNDCVPIIGYRRKPYMILGWIGCAVLGFILFAVPLPHSRVELSNSTDIDAGYCPYNKSYNHDEDTYYEEKARDYMVLLFLFNVFLVLTDVAMDGLMVQYARRESLSLRGRAQTMIYVSRQIGIVVGAIIKGLGLNWYDYRGPWCKGFDVNILFLLCAIASCLAIPSIWFMTWEERVTDRKPFKHIVKKTWKILKSKAVLQILLFQTGTAMFMSISSPADSKIQREWLEMDNLARNVLMNALGGVVFAVGASIFAKYLLNKNWVWIFGGSSFLVTLLNAGITYIVVYDVVRNQYFYLSDEVCASFFFGVNFICGLLLFVEISEAETEGTTYALVTTFANCGTTFGSILGNFIVAPFNVSGDERFDRDSEEDRNIVAIQYAIIFLCNLATLLFLPLLPKGKKETQALKDRAGISKPLAILAIVLGLFLFWFTLLYSFILSRYLKF